ncbi:MAG: extracellular solute-binding protein [Ignavibacteria bacterium]|jgi:multiple sugar transport system substrate-binding protein|nr:extracellular solute-binding protein [Ignavibacteria bacterium]
MKRKCNYLFLCLGLFLPILILFSSCRKNEEADNTIKFWHFWSEPSQKKVLDKLIKRFEEQNNCKVELTELSWNDGKTKLLAAFNSNVAPDVLELGSDWVSQFSSSDVLEELNPDSVQIDRFVEISLAPTKWKGKLFALPWVLDTRVLFCNKDLMKSGGVDTVPPQDYLQLVQFANVINNPLKEIYGFGTNGSDPHRLYKKILPMFWTFGGSVFDENGNLVLNSVSNVEALGIYVQLSRAGIIETQRQLDAYFAQGKIAFIFSGAWLMKKIEKENPNLNYEIAMMPRYLLNPGISFLGGEYLAISKSSNKKELGLKLIKFLSDGKNALELAKNIDEAGFPADKNFIKNEALLQNNRKSVFAQQLLFAKSTPVHKKWLDIEAIIEYAVTEAIYGQKSEQQALDDAQVEILKIINE